MTLRFRNLPQSSPSPNSEGAKTAHNGGARGGLRGPPGTAAATFSPRLQRATDRTARRIASFVVYKGSAYLSLCDMGAVKEMLSAGISDADAREASDEAAIDAFVSNAPRIAPHSSSGVSSSYYITSNSRRHRASSAAVRSSRAAAAAVHVVSDIVGNECVLRSIVGSGPTFPPASAFSRPSHGPLATSLALHQHQHASYSSSSSSFAFGEDHRPSVIRRENANIAASASAAVATAAAASAREAGAAVVRSFPRCVAVRSTTDTLVGMRVTLRAVTARLAALDAVCVHLTSFRQGSGVRSPLPPLAGPNPPQNTLASAPPSFSSSNAHNNEGPPEGSVPPERWRAEFGSVLLQLRTLHSQLSVDQRRLVDFCETKVSSHV